MTKAKRKGSPVCHISDVAAIEWKQPVDCVILYCRMRFHMPILTEMACAGCVDIMALHISFSGTLDEY